MASFRKLFTIIITAFFVVLFIQNVSTLGSELPFHFFTYDPIRLMAGYWFILFAGTGLFFGAILNLKSYFSHSKEVKTLKAEIKHLTEELARHRTLSLDETKDVLESVSEDVLDDADEVKDAAEVVKDASKVLEP